MKAVRCTNGHWYDAETYDVCPRCGQRSPAVEHQVDDASKGGKKSFSSIFKRNREESASRTPDNNINVNKEKPVISVTNQDVTEQFFAEIDDDKTVSMIAPDDQNVTQIGVPISSATVSLPVNPTPVNSAVNVNPEPAPAPAPVKTPSEPLATAVQRVSSMDDGKTLSYFNALTSQKESSPNEAEKPKRSTEPVVGWLVAVEGVHLGESFPIYVGKNTIGRSAVNKVVLSLDHTVSRENQGMIIYEPKRRDFYLQSGSSDHLIYLNDNFINGTEKINARDIIEVGSTKLLFVPLCGPDFSWEQYI